MKMKKLSQETCYSIISEIVVSVVKYLIAYNRGRHMSQMPQGKFEGVYIKWAWHVSAF